MIGFLLFQSKMIQMHFILRKLYLHPSNFSLHPSYLCIIQFKIMIWHHLQISIYEKHHFNYSRITFIFFLFFFYGLFSSQQQTLRENIFDKKKKKTCLKIIKKNLKMIYKWETVHGPNMMNTMQISKLSPPWRMD